MFNGCSFPGENREYCLLLDHRISSGDTNPDPRFRRPDKRHDYMLAAGRDAVASYLSELSGFVEDPADVLSGFTQEDMRRLLERHDAINGECVVTLYLCDTGGHGGIKRVHSRTDEFRFNGLDD